MTAASCNLKKIKTGRIVYSRQRRLVMRDSLPAVNRKKRRNLVFRMNVKRNELMIFIEHRQFDRG